MLTTDQARELIGKRVPWLDGKPLNSGTFDKLISEGILKVKARYPNGARFFLEDDVLPIIKKLRGAPGRPADKIGIVGWIQGKRSKAGRK